MRSILRNGRLFAARFIGLSAVAFSEARCTDSNRPARSSVWLNRKRPAHFLIGSCRDDPLHHGDQPFLVRLTKIGYRLTVCGASRCFHSAEQARSGLCQPANLRPAVPMVNRALDKVTGLQPLKGACCRRAIERDVVGQSGLVGGSALRQSGEKAVLQRRNLKRSAALLEQRDVNLVQPPDQESRPLVERPGITGLWRWLPRHLHAVLTHAASI